MADKFRLSADDIAINEAGEIVIRNEDLAAKLREAAGAAGLRKAAIHNIACGNNYQCGKALRELEWTGSAEA